MHDQNVKGLVCLFVHVYRYIKLFSNSYPEETTIGLHKTKTSQLFNGDMFFISRARGLKLIRSSFPHFSLTLNIRDLLICLVIHFKELVTSIPL